MSFRLNSAARRWFSDVRPRMSIDFDYYYLCFIAGLAARRKKSIALAETDELIQYFPSEYRSRCNVLIAMLLKAELEEMGVALADRASVNSVIRRLVNTQSASRLSEEGEKTMNRYADGGFEALTEWFEGKPRSFEIFVQRYKKFVEEKNI